MPDRRITETGTAACPFSFGATPADAGVGRSEAPLCSGSFAGDVLRVALDTNVLVSLWVFSDSRFAPLRAALEDGRWRAITNAACFGEFARVLDYPQFGVAPERQRIALAEYRSLAEEVTAIAVDAAPLPRCQDRDDQKFLELARDGRADWLVTADKALLRLARRQKLAHLFRIVTPDAALAALTG